MPQFKKMARLATQDASPISKVPNDATGVTAATAPGTGDAAWTCSVASGARC